MKPIKQKKECLEKLLNVRIDLFKQKINELNVIDDKNYNDFLEKLIKSLSGIDNVLIREINLCQNNDNSDNTYSEKVRKTN